jgi:serine phosphatase RsbU (regulator of sigma subunit)
VASSPADSTDAAPSDAVTDAPWRARHARLVGGLITLVLGLGVTAIVTWSVHSNYQDTESRLLHLQVEQAGDVVLAAVSNVNTPLEVAASIAAGSSHVAQGFDHVMGPQVGAKGYLDVSLWEDTDGRLTVLSALGMAAYVHAPSSTALELARQAQASTSFIVQPFLTSPQPRIAYVYALPRSGLVVYAERAVPARGYSAVKSNQAFSDLGFAIYLGRDTKLEYLLVQVDTKVPIRGATAQVSIPFGNSALTIVVTPLQSLTGSLTQELVWIFGIGGVVLSLLGAAIAQQLVHGRRMAELDAARSRRLSDTLAQLYAEQRSIAETLQRSLLPVRNPVVPGMAVASRYVAGSIGTEVGGDWYSLVMIDETKYAFVVGDVSGRGIQAATVMAALRFTIRTLALEGHPPHVVLDRCAHQVRDQLQGRFATALVGVGDTATQELTLANAGHLPPLLFAGDHTEFVHTKVGPPLGVDGSAYESTTVATPRGATLLAYTDGLVERRGESLDVGFRRLASAATRGPEDLDALLTSIITELTDNHSEDDIAVLALRFS